MKMKLANELHLSLILVATVIASAGHAAPIHGGPEYNPTTETGYQLPSGYNNVERGFGAGYAHKYEAGIDKGDRAVLWDATGVIELDHLGTDSSGATRSVASSVNASGTAVGFAIKFDDGIGKGFYPVRWDTSGVATELGILGTNSLGTTQSEAVDVNASGTVIGYARKHVSGNFKGDRAVRWETGQTAAIELGDIGTDSNGITNTYASALNMTGMVVGAATKYEAGNNKGVRPVRWDASGNPTELGNLGTDSSDTARGSANVINSAGTAAGYSKKYVSGSDKGERAVRWDAGGTAATELDNLGTNNSGVTTSRARAISANGTVVGYARKYVAGGDKGLRAVRWDAGSAVATELGTLGTDSGGVTASTAYEINAAGIAVGYAREYAPSGTLLGQRAVAWGLDGVAINLNTLLDPETGWVNLVEADDISETSWISGIGAFDPDDEGPQTAYNRLFLLDAISLFGTPGDATRDNVVNFDDLLILAQNYNATSARWDDGDFNGDEVVAFDDLLSLAQQYGFGTVDLTAADFAADWALARSLVPEWDPLESTCRHASLSIL